MSLNYKIIVTRNVKEYRKAAISLIGQNYHVIEIGCASGKTTAVIARRAKKVLALDKSEKEVKRAAERLKNYANTVVLELDAFNVREVIKHVKSFLGGRVDAILIDIGGREDIAKVVTLITKYAIVFKPKLIIVKNTYLVDFLERSEVWSTRSKSRTGT